MSDRRWDNPDWHEGMTLPSRKDKHKYGRKKKSQERSGRSEPRQKSGASDAVTAAPQPDATHSALQEIQQAQAEATATAELQKPREIGADANAGVPAPSGLHANAEADARAWRELQETDVEANSDEEDQEGEFQPFFSRGQRVLIWVGTILVILFVLAWGKIGYVHHVPDIVRQNVTAYDRGPAFLIIKPWWFGPPVIDLTEYTRSGETPDWDIYRARLGDYAGVVDNPDVLWYFQEDRLP